MFGSRLPLSDRAAAWINQSLGWLNENLGVDAALRPVLLPQAATFGGHLSGTEADVEPVLEVLCGRMAVPRTSFSLEIVDDDDPSELAAHLPITYRTSGAAAEVTHGDGFHVRVSTTLFGRNELVAALAHELAHVKLLSETKVSASAPDHEQLTDLTTVWFGAGIFAANAAVEVRTDGRMRSTSTLGYLSEEMFGYALARWALIRGEVDPDWQRHLDANPRGYLRQSLKALQRKADRSTPTTS